MNWLHYLLEANIYLAVFYAGYQLFLKNETYYTLNRVYLLLGCVLSFVLPLLQLGILKPADQGAVTTVYIANTALKPVSNQPADFNMSIQNVLFYVYLLGVIILAVILLLKLFKLTSMTRTALEMAGDKYKIVPVEGSNTAFSFFNYLFIGSKTTGSDIIIRHELVHIRQKHTLDVLFLELVKIINWFNPFVYLLQNSIKTVHEYIADEQTAAYETDALTYSSFLVNNAYGLNGTSLTNSFFNYNLLKKRIIMLNQKRSGSLARLKYLMAIPIFGASLCASTLGFSKNYGWIDLAPQHPIVDSSEQAKHHLMPPPPPPPILIKNGYMGLFNHLNKNIKYPQNEVKNKRSGLVIVAFNVGADHKLSDAKILKSTDNRFDDQTLKAFQSYKSTIGDKAGEHKVTVGFYSDFAAQAPQYASEVEQSGAVFNLSAVVTPQQSAAPEAIGQPSPKPSVAFPKPKASVKGAKIPPPPPPVPPKSASEPAPVQAADQKMPPPPPPKEPIKQKLPRPLKEDPIGQRLPRPLPPKDPFSELYTYIAKYVRYPAEARDNRYAGRVILNFNLNNGKIEDVKITRGLLNVLDAEALRVIKSYDSTLPQARSANYSIPISFTLIDQNSVNVGKIPDNKTQTDDNDKQVANSNAFKPGTSYMLNEVVVTGYVNTK
ncbi:MAG: TonB family protein [Mucilaginibacter sp.]|uniref:TonB family protein n=1 Tax=Mucilaginibacter sp. TaxID=1882438 RepID=UPI0031B095CE